jgi:MFS family permease
MIGLAITIFLVVDILLELPTGVFGDGFSRKKQAIIGTIIMFLSCIGLYLAETTTIIIVSYAIMGIGWAFFFGSREAWVVDQLKRDKKSKYITQYYARSQFFFMIGAILGPLITSLIVTNENMRIIWLIDAIITLVTIVPMMMEKEIFSKRNKFGKIFKESVKNFFSNKKLVLVGITYFISSFYLGSIVGQQPFLIFLGAPLLILGLKESVSSIVRALSLMIIGWIHKRAKLFVVLAALIQFFIMIPLIFLVEGQWVIAVILLIVPSMFAFIDPIIFGFQNKHIPNKFRSSMTSIIGTCASIGSIAGFFFGGYVLESVGPAWTIVLFSSGFLISSIIYLKLLPKSL